MNKVCEIDGKPLKKDAKRFCSRECKAKSQLGHIPWNKGLTIEDPRIKNGIEKSTKTIRKQYQDGRKSWITNRTKENEPILQKTALILSEIVKEQYAKKGRKQWFKERPGFTRKGKKNSDYQKQVERKTMLRSIFNGKIPHRKSKNELTVVQMLKDAGFTLQDVMVDEICYPDRFIVEKFAFFFYDGPYYHEMLQRIETDKRQTLQLLKMGCNIIRMNEEQFNSLGGSLEKLKQFIDDNLIKP